MRSILPLFAFGLALAAPASAAENIALPEFKSVQLIGGGKLTFRPGPVQRVTMVNGSTAITRFRMIKSQQLKIFACNQRCPHGYRLEVTIEGPTMPVVAVTGGGSIVAADGFQPQPNVVAAVSGGGQIDLRSVPANSAAAAVSGGGDIRVRARSALAGTVKGGGLIRYWGDPQVTSVVNGGGAVRRGD